jgi:hypothetical protein
MTQRAAWNMSAAHGRQSTARKLKSMSGRARHYEPARVELVAVLIEGAKRWRSPIQDEWPLTVCSDIWPARGPSSLSLGDDVDVQGDDE